MSAPLTAWESGAENEVFVVEVALVSQRGSGKRLAGFELLVASTYFVKKKKGGGRQARSVRTRTDASCALEQPVDLEDLTGTTLPATNPSSIFCSLLSYIFAFFLKKKERLKQLLGDACDRCCVLLSGEQCLELGKLSLRKISAAVSKRVPPKSWSLGHAQTMHVIVGAGYSFKDLNFGSLYESLSSIWR